MSGERSAVSGSPAAPSAHRSLPGEEPLSKRINLGSARDGRWQHPGDPAVFALVATALTAVVLLACWIPARRATRVNPVDALRFD